jgi:hypothetical protein
LWKAGVNARRTVVLATPLVVVLDQVGFEDEDENEEGTMGTGGDTF